MKTYVSILRGINVSGKKIIVMSDLKQIFMELGFSHVITYIQSGNVIFDSIESAEPILSEQIKSAINEKYGFDTTVLVIEKENWLTIIKETPFPEKDIKFLHLTFLEKQPGSITTEDILKAKKGSEEFRIIGARVYLYCPEGYGKTKLSNQFLERKLKVTATTRNWKTVCKIGEMLTDQTV